MPSPFPGMDPYIEASDVWHDFHTRYVPALSAVLLPGLPAHYVVKLDVNVYIRELPADRRALVGRPDAVVLSPGGRRPGVGAAAAGLAPPVVAELAVPAVDVERQPYAEVIDLRDRAVVTVIELLSPSNKSDPADRAAYLAKRRRLRAEAVHFVELDLLRGGPRMPVSGLPACDYYAMVSRAEDRPRVGIWPIGVRDRLPAIPIPLAAGDAAVPLDLQLALDQVYDGAGYARYVYAAEPDPPLPPADAAWAAERVAAVVRR